MKKMIVLTLLAWALSAKAEILFSDDFNSGASSLWGNEVGAWSAVGGVYAHRARQHAKCYLLSTV